jgi:hypothetical protein
MKLAHIAAILMSDTVSSNSVPSVTYCGLEDHAQKNIKRVRGSTEEKPGMSDVTKAHFKVFAPLPIEGLIGTEIKTDGLSAKHTF